MGEEKKEPVLLVMAAGMGSRYGGLKQIDPVDREGHIIMDFSVFDAVRAGFKKVIFIIKPENEDDFRSAILNRLPGHVGVEVAFQVLTDLPEGFSVPEGRVKPWGTGHAVLSCRKLVDGPFAVINADDFYGRHAFAMAYDFLSRADGEQAVQPFMMVGYKLSNTLTENGHVSRGICETDDGGCLTGITERTHIEKREKGAAFTEDNGESWTALSGEETVSMNMWGFTGRMMDELWARFTPFLEKGLAENPLKCEYFLPFVVDELLREKKARVRVLKSEDKWFGVTYREDKPTVVASIQRMKDEGIYPEKLWEA